MTGPIALVVYPNSANATFHAAKCEKLPNVEWWSKSHARVIRTVTKNYKGNWNRYIGRWQTYHNRMQKLFNSKSVAVVKSRGLKLKGKQFEAHIKDINARLKVLRCLEKSQQEIEAKDLESFSTAAGGNTPKSPKNSRATQVASGTGKNLDIEVTARCIKDTAVFQITNLGKKWPRLGEINIYKVDGKALISKRRVRMTNSQQATFKVRKRGTNSNGTVGIWISPSWNKRAFKYDAKINCE